MRKTLNGVPLPDDYRTNAGAHPETTRALAEAQKAAMAAQASRVNAQSNVLQSIYNQAGPMAQAVSGAYGAYANAMPGMYTPYANTIASANNNYAQMFDAYGRNAGQYFNAVGNIGANAMAQAGNANQDRYSAYAQGNAAYQNLLGGLGAAALGAFGSSANAAMQAQALNSTAALKAMADAIGQNQQATSTYGASRNQALAGLAAALANAGTGFSNSRAVNSAAASQLGGQGAAAYSNLGSALGTAAGNLGASAGNSEAALRSASAQALGNISAAESTGLANLGGASSAALGGLAPSMTAAAGNDLNYTRDMAKLGLARELGLVGANVAGSMAGGISDPGGGISIYGPDGLIAGGSYAGLPSSGAGFTAVDPYSNTPWYAGRQAAGGAGLAALSGLQSDMTRAGAEQAAGVRGSAAASRGDVNAGAAAGSGNIQSGLWGGMNQINAEGQSGRSGIADALAAAQQQIDIGGRGIDSDMASTFGGLESTSRNIMAGDVLQNLNANYGSGMRQLGQAFMTGQRDPRDIYASTLSGITGLLSPLVDRGTAAMGDFYGNFPEALNPAGGGQLNPQPYLDELRRAYDPYLANLNAAFLGQNQRIAGGVSAAGQGYRSGVSDLATNLSKASNQIGGMFSTLMDDHAGRILPAKKR